MEALVHLHWHQPILLALLRIVQLGLLNMLPNAVAQRTNRCHKRSVNALEPRPLQARQPDRESTGISNPKPVPENNLRGIITYSGTTWKGVGMCQRNTCALRVLDGAMPFGSRGLRQELAAEAGRYDPGALATFYRVVPPRPTEETSRPRLTRLATSVTYGCQML